MTICQISGEIQRSHIVIDKGALMCSGIKNSYRALHVLRCLPAGLMLWGGEMTGARAPLKIIPTHRTTSSRKTSGVPPADTTESPKPKLLDQLRKSLHFPETGYDIRTAQELLGHSDVKTTMIYPHVLNRGPAGVRSPMDGL